MAESAFDPDGLLNFNLGDFVEPRFYHEGLDSIYARAQAQHPDASEHYFKITDQDICDCLNPALVATPSHDPSHNGQKLSSVQSTLAARPNYTTIEVPAPQFTVLTCMPTISESISQIKENIEGYRILKDAGIDIFLLKRIEDATRSGSVAWFQPNDEDEHCDFKNDAHLRHLEWLATQNIGDKVCIREIAEGHFRQPEYLDGRYIQSRSEYAFGVIQPDSVYQQIPAAFFDKNTPIAVLFTSAFTLIREGDKVASIPFQDSRGKVIRALEGIHNSPEKLLLNAMYGTVPSAEEQVRDLFKFYTDKGLRFTSDMVVDDDSSDRFTVRNVAELLLSAKEPVYIKGSTSSGGRMIVKLGFDELGNPYIETSSPQVHDMIGARVFMAEEALEEFARVHQEGEQLFESSIRDLKKEIVSRTLENSKISVQKILSGLLENIKHPIIEKEIPFETLDGARVEFRIICQTTNTNDTPQVVAHYCKESNDPIAANISISGRGAVSSDVMKGLVAQRQEMLSQKGIPTDIDTQAQQLMSEMIGAVNDFAPHYFEQRGLKSFAVDLVPVWNQEKKALEFWLLEVQDSFAFTGLTSIDPEAALRVEERLSQLKALAQIG